MPQTVMTESGQSVNSGAREPAFEDRRLGILLLLVALGFAFRLEDSSSIPHSSFPIGLAAVCFLLAAIRLFFVRTSLAQSAFHIAVPVIMVALIESAFRVVGRL